MMEFPQELRELLYDSQQGVTFWVKGTVRDFLQNCSSFSTILNNRTHKPLVTGPNLVAATSFYFDFTILGIPIHLGVLSKYS